MRVSGWFCLVGIAAMCASGVAQDVFGPQPQLSGKVVYMVSPTTADPGLKTTEDGDNVAMLPKGTPRPELFVWLPGTNGHPKGDPYMLDTAVNGGYRVIGLQYNDRGTVENQCKAAHDPECLTKMRRERFTGDVADAAIPNTPDEGVEHRLTMLLKYLAAKHPEDGWGQYLDGDAPAWKKIVIAGHSQGAGMAGYIAKNREVARVELFSGGVDGDGMTIETRKWSSWLTIPGKTPMDRWYAEYSNKEAVALAQPTAFIDVLKIPADHVLVFKLDLPETAKMGKPLEAHMSVVHDGRYLPQWQWMDGLTTVKPGQ